jgi:hypothetical protein
MKHPKSTHNHQSFQHDAPTPFITANQQDRNDEEEDNEDMEAHLGEADSLSALLQEDETDVDNLKMKIGYLVKQEKDLPRKIAKSLVNEGKVFQKNFEMIKKID